MSNNYFTVITTTDKTYFTGRGNTEEKSLSQAIALYNKHQNDSEILSLRTYDFM